MEKRLQERGQSLRKGASVRGACTKTNVRARAQTRKQHRDVYMYKHRYSLYRLLCIFTCLPSSCKGLKQHLKTRRRDSLVRKVFGSFTS